MSDTFYREQAARRRRRLLLIGIPFVSLICLAFGVYSALRDTCTGSFERSPEAVIRSYVAAIAQGDPRTAQACWDHLAYLDLESGCSEICLSRLWGTPYALQEVQLSQPVVESRRARIQAQVEISCPDGAAHTAAITLDSVSADLPWRHWKIIRSDLGGPLSAPWCK